jgi:hypothetical protein
MSSGQDAGEDGRVVMNRALHHGELFLCDRIASELARLPGQFEIDRDEKLRILRDLGSRCDAEYFKAHETLVCAGEPPRLVSIHEIDEQHRAIQPVMLTRAACKRYLEQSASPNAPRLIAAWFGGLKITPPGRNERKRSGPAPGTTERYANSDRELYSEIKILLEGGRTVTAACQYLAENGRIAGGGTAESRARRLQKRFPRECRRGN